MMEVAVERYRLGAGGQQAPCGAGRQIELATSRRRDEEQRGKPLAQRDQHGRWLADWRCNAAATLTMIEVEY